MGRPVGLGSVVWIIIGVLVAVDRDFLSHLDTVSGVLSAILAILAWPLVVFNVHVSI
jgi:hypothetical protein